MGKYPKSIRAPTGSQGTTAVVAILGAEAATLCRSLVDLCVWLGLGVHGGMGGIKIRQPAH